MKKTLVKLDNFVAEIKETNGKLIASKLSDDELFENTVLDDKVADHFQNEINVIAQEVYTEVKKGFKHCLKENVLRVVGFENRYGNQWAVDHCNGRSSVLTEYMSEKVKTMFREEFDAILQPEITKLLQQTKTSLIKEFKEEFLRHVRYSMRDIAHNQAKAFLNDVVAKSILKNQKKLIKDAGKAFLGKDICVKPVADSDF